MSVCMHADDVCVCVCVCVCVFGEKEGAYLDLFQLI